METADSKILVVDDNEDNRYTLIRRLKRTGYEDVTEAVDGEDALARLATTTLRPCSTRRHDAESERLSSP